MFPHIVAVLFFTAESVEYIDMCISENNRNQTIGETNFTPIWLTEIDSTNSHAVREFAALQSHTLIVADHQTSGKGRKGRKWYSPPHVNLYASYLLKDWPFPAFQATWVASLCILELLRETAVDVDFWLKWPNDIYCGNKKICGFLAEAKFDSQNKIAGVICGFGVNLNMSSHDLARIDQPATSLLVEAGKQVNVKKFALELGNKLVELYNTTFISGIDNIYRIWKSENRVIGQKVELATDNNKILVGDVIDITSTGTLVFKHASGGSPVEFASGDVKINPKALEAKAC